MTVLAKVEACSERAQCLEELQRVPRKIKIFHSEDHAAESAHYRELYEEALHKIGFVSETLRSAQSVKVTIQPLCDILWLYANTHTYFTPNEGYKRTKGDEQKIRKCDVRLGNIEVIRNEAGEEILNVVDQERTVYKGSKEYDQGYIWGQLVGWFKQTVDKPNASLSADRRGTLSMPDLESFIVSAKNQQEEIKGAKRKGGKGGKDSDSDEDDFFSAPPKPQGTRTRPEESQIKVAYPHKKHQTRQAFLEHWPDNFSKQWDVCCHWSFKNRHRMYGSVQFESVLRAGPNRDSRQDFFQRAVLDALRLHK